MASVLYSESWWAGPSTRSPQAPGHTSCRGILMAGGAVCPGCGEPTGWGTRVPGTARPARSCRQQAAPGRVAASAPGPGQLDRPSRRRALGHGGLDHAGHGGHGGLDHAGDRVDPFGGTGSAAIRIMITSIRRPRIVQDSGQAESRGARRRARAGSGSVTDKQVVWTFRADKRPPAATGGRCERCPCARPGPAEADARRWP
jgi:hypothetical protein